VHHWPVQTRGSFTPSLGFEVCVAYGPIAASARRVDSRRSCFRFPAEYDGDGAESELVWGTASPAASVGIRSTLAQAGNSENSGAQAARRPASSSSLLGDERPPGPATNGSGSRRRRRAPSEVSEVAPARGGAG
jgi:hypothetical protein